jgi:hypothetical protein
MPFHGHTNVLDQTSDLKKQATDQTIWQVQRVPPSFWYEALNVPLLLAIGSRVG